MKCSLLVLLGVLLVTSLVGAQESGVSAARFARLARGVNLPNWFWPTPESFVEDYYDEVDFALIHDMGLTAVRLPIHLDFLLDESSDDLLCTGEPQRQPQNSKARTWALRIRRSVAKG